MCWFLLCVLFAPFAPVPSCLFVVPACKSSLSSSLSSVVCWLSVHVLEASDQKVDFFLSRLCCHGAAAMRSLPFSSLPGHGHSLFLLQVFMSQVELLVAFLKCASLGVLFCLVLLLDANTVSSCRVCAHAHTTRLMQFKKRGDGWCSGNVAWGQSIDEARRDEGAPPCSLCSSLHTILLSLSPMLSLFVQIVSMCM